VTNSDIATYADDQAATQPGQLWKNLIGGHRYVIRQKSGVLYLRDINAASDLVSGFGGSLGNTAPTVIRGALRGAHLCFVSNDGLGNGQIYVALDGVTFNARVTFKPGVADFLQRAGGLRGCWLVYNTTNSNEIFRTTQNIDSAIAGDWTNKTGNYWTDIQTDGQAFNARDLSVVHKA